MRFPAIYAALACVLSASTGLSAQETLKVHIRAHSTHHKVTALKSELLMRIAESRILSSATKDASDVALNLTEVQGCDDEDPTGILYVLTLRTPRRVILFHDGFAPAGAETTWAASILNDLRTFATAGMQHTGAAAPGADVPPSYWIRATHGQRATQIAVEYRKIAAQREVKLTVAKTPERAGLVTFLATPAQACSNGATPLTMFGFFVARIQTRLIYEAAAAATTVPLDKTAAAANGVFVKMMDIMSGTLDDAVDEMEDEAFRLKLRQWKGGERDR